METDLYVNVFQNLWRPCAIDDSECENDTDFLSHADEDTNSNSGSDTEQIGACRVKSLYAQLYLKDAEITSLSRAWRQAAVEWEKKINAADSKISSLKAQLDSTTEDRRVLETRVKAAMKDIEEKESKIKYTSGQASSYQEEIRVLQGRTKTLEESLSASKSQINKIILNQEVGGNDNTSNDVHSRHRQPRDRSPLARNIFTSNTDTDGMRKRFEVRITQLEKQLAEQHETVKRLSEENKLLRTESNKKALEVGSIVNLDPVEKKTTMLNSECQTEHQASGSNAPQRSSAMLHESQISSTDENCQDGSGCSQCALLQKDMNLLRLQCDDIESAFLKEKEVTARLEISNLELRDALQSTSNVGREEILCLEKQIKTLEIDLTNERKIIQSIQRLQQRSLNASLKRFFATPHRPVPLKSADLTVLCNIIPGKNCKSVGVQAVVLTKSKTMTSQHIVVKPTTLTNSKESFPRLRDRHITKKQQLDQNSPPFNRPRSHSWTGRYEALPRSPFFSVSPKTTVKKTESMPTQRLNLSNYHHLDLYGTSGHQLPFSSYVDSSLSDIFTSLNATNSRKQGKEKKKLTSLNEKEHQTYKNDFLGRRVQLPLLTTRSDFGDTKRLDKNQSWCMLRENVKLPIRSNPILPRRSFTSYEFQEEGRPHGSNNAITYTGRLNINSCNKLAASNGFLRKNVVQGSVHENVPESQFSKFTNNQRGRSALAQKFEMPQYSYTPLRSKASNSLQRKTTGSQRTFSCTDESSEGNETDVDDEEEACTTKTLLRNTKYLNSSQFNNTYYNNREPALSSSFQMTFKSDIPVCNSSRSNTTTIDETITPAPQYYTPESRCCYKSNRKGGLLFEALTALQNDPLERLCSYPSDVSSSAADTNSYWLWNS